MIGLFVCLFVCLFVPIDRTFCLFACLFVCLYLLIGLFVCLFVCLYLLTGLFVHNYNSIFNSFWDDFTFVMIKRFQLKLLERLKEIRSTLEKSKFFASHEVIGKCVSNWFTRLVYEVGDFLHLRIPGGYKRSCQSSFRKNESLVCGGMKKVLSVVWMATRLHPPPIWHALSLGIFRSKPANFNYWL
jgi:hypothetical protein